MSDDGVRLLVEVRQVNEGCEETCNVCDEPIPVGGSVPAVLADRFSSMFAPLVCARCFICPRCGHEHLDVFVVYETHGEKKVLRGRNYGIGCPECRAHWFGTPDGLAEYQSELRARRKAQREHRESNAPCTGQPEVIECDECPARQVCAALGSAGLGPKSTDPHERETN
jgi:hypothetical protein